MRLAEGIKMSNAAASARNQPSAPQQASASPAVGTGSGAVRSNTRVATSSSRAPTRARASPTTMSTSTSDQHPAERMTFEARLQQLRLEVRQELQAQESSMANLIGSHMKSAMADMVQSMVAMVNNAVTAALTTQMPALLAHLGLIPASLPLPQTPGVILQPQPQLLTATASLGERSVAASTKATAAATTSEPGLRTQPPGAVAATPPAAIHPVVTNQRPLTPPAASTTLLSATAGPARHGPVSVNA
jgi:hypothetical protein